MQILKCLCGSFAEDYSHSTEKIFFSCGFHGQGILVLARWWACVPRDCLFEYKLLWVVPYCLPEQLLARCYELLCLFARAQLPEGATNVPEVQFQSPSDRVVIHPGTLDRSAAGHQLHRGHQKLWPRSKVYLGVGNQLFNT